MHAHVYAHLYVHMQVHARLYIHAPTSCVHVVPHMVCITCARHMNANMLCIPYAKPACSVAPRAQVEHPNYV